MKRLIEHIRSSSLKSEKLAERANLTAERLEQIIEGSEPSITELHNIAAALKLPLTFLTEREDTHTRGSVLFRNAVKEKPKYETALFKICELVRLSIQVLPESKQPPWWLFEYPNQPVSYQAAEEYSIRFRSQFFDSNNFDPLVTLPQILDRDCDVMQFVIPGERIEGASVISDGYSFTFLSPRFPARMLYTLAHELGHLIAHHSKANGAIVLDTPSSIASMRPARDIREQFANAFAACLLMPQQGLATALKKIRQHASVRGDEVGEYEILFLSRIFGVSFQVAALRCEQLQLVPQGAAIALNNTLKKQFGSAERRAKDLDLPPTAKVKFPLLPKMLVKHLKSNIMEGSISVGHVANTLGMPIDQLQELEVSQVH